MPEPAPSTTPEDSVIQKERHQLLAQGLRTLPKVQQRAMWLRYIKELSYREIVWEMQAPLGTVKIWLYRGRHQLKRALEKQVGSWRLGAGDWLGLTGRLLQTCRRDHCIRPLRGRLLSSRHDPCLNHAGAGPSRDLGGFC